jgi:hypothetical protein
MSSTISLRSVDGGDWVASKDMNVVSKANGTTVEGSRASPDQSCNLEYTKWTRFPRFKGFHSREEVLAFV